MSMKKKSLTVESHRDSKYFICTNKEFREDTLLTSNKRRKGILLMAENASIIIQKNVLTLTYDLAHSSNSVLFIDDRITNITLIAH